MRLYFLSFYLIALTVLTNCVNNENGTSLNQTEDEYLTGSWRFVLNARDNQIPFQISFEAIEDGYLGKLKNGEEEILIDNVLLQKDSVSIELPYFQSYFKGRIESENLITGKWINENKKDYEIPFVAEKGKNFRFTPSNSSTEIHEQYHVVFSDANGDEWNSVLMLKNDSGRISGTFTTETGDYRYLQGNIMNNGVYLSTFNGSHAFVFSADIQEDRLVNGKFISGIHYSANWEGEADTTYILRDPYNLTQVNSTKENYIELYLPNQNGDTLNWEEINPENKVAIIDIMGSWCPNCLDANKAIKELRDQIGEDQIQLITVAYETTDNLETAKTRVFKMQSQLGMEKNFLFGGRADKNKVLSDFPLLNDFSSYPTLIFVGKDRKIRIIYTGFYGPGTGKYYDTFMKQTRKLLEDLVSEPTV